MKRGMQFLERETKSKETENKIFRNSKTMKECERNFSVSVSDLKFWFPKRTTEIFKIICGTVEAIKLLLKNRKRL